MKMFCLEVINEMNDKRVSDFKEKRENRENE